MEEEKKVCIIDNFEEIVVSDKLIKKILHYLTCKFGIVVITSNLQNDLLGFLKKCRNKRIFRKEIHAPIYSRPKKLYEKKISK